MNHDCGTPTPLLRRYFAMSFRDACSLDSMKTTNLALVEARRAWYSESLEDTCCA